MREVGVIKWFGGYNANKGRDNDYGFVAAEGKQDLYVHRSECRCSDDFLIEGTPITFEIGVNRMTGKEQAINVLILTEETDLETMSKAAHMSEQKFWQPVIVKYFQQADLDEAADVAIKRIQSLSMPMLGDFLYRIPDRLRNHKKLQAYLQKEAEKEVAKAEAEAASATKEEAPSSV